MIVKMKPKTPSHHPLAVIRGTVGIYPAVLFFLFLVMVGCVRFEKMDIVEMDGVKKEQVKRYWGPSWQEIVDRDEVKVRSGDDETTGGVVVSEFRSQRREGETELHLFDVVKDVVSGIVGLVAGLVL